MKSICGVLTLAILLGGLFAFGGIKEVAAEVQVNINIGPPPAFALHAPPRVVVIPGTYMYVVPEIDVDIMFYKGYWYRPHEGRWYRAKSYNGSWKHLAPGKVPRALGSLPPDYRRVPPGYRHISHAELKKNWGKWERERHWDKDKQWREGRHEKPEGKKGEQLHGKPEAKGGEWRDEKPGKPEKPEKPERKGGGR
jgi:hypothetical protein